MKLWHWCWIVPLVFLYGGSYFTYQAGSQWWVFPTFALTVIGTLLTFVMWIGAVLENE
jgi:hypothetical protein